MRYLAVLFDLDGTIIDSRNSIMNAMRKTADEFGLPDSAVTIGSKLIGYPLPEILKRMGVKDFERGVGVYRKHYYELIDTERPFDGVPEMLHALHGRALLSVATNKGKPSSGRVLQSTGLDKYFDVVVSIDEAEPKPSTAMFGKVTEHYAREGKFLEPADVLIVGDSPTDVDFAVNCGSDCAFVRWGFFGLEQCACSPAYVVGRPEELIAIVEGDAVSPEIGWELDLHTYTPDATAPLVSDYLGEAKKKGMRTVRIVHGKGKGIQREIVRRTLATRADVEKYYDAPASFGGLGATIVELKEE